MEDENFVSYIEINVGESSIYQLDEASPVYEENQSNSIQQVLLNEASDNKENRSVLLPIQPVKSKAKKEQFEQIMQFLKVNNEALMDKDEYNKLWNNLTSQLNAIGPPSFSSAEWKRKWSDHKYNKKRKRSIDDSMLENEPKRISESDAATINLVQPPVDSENILLLRVLVQKQDVLIQQQKVIIEKIDKFISLFEEQKCSA